MDPKIRLNNDAPKETIDQDYLNRKPFVNIVTGLLKENIETPYSIGIYGNWGSGKTTIMNFVKDSIEKETNYLTLWFDAWEYENEENLIYPMIRLIRNCIPKEKIESVKENIKKLSTVLLKASSDVILHKLTLGGINAEKIEKYGLEYEKAHTSRFDEWIDMIEKSRNAFKQLVKTACEKNKKEYLVLFIDDLDRCLPENAIKILEGIKNIFSDGNCIFVIALDRETIARGIENRYQALTENECNDYLDKIINFGLEVPELELDDFEKYIICLHDDLHIAKYNDLIRKFSNICVSSRFHNPRKLKRIFNKYFLLVKISKEKKFNIRLLNTESKDGSNGELWQYSNNRDILSYLFLYEFWNDLYRLALADNEVINILNKHIDASNFRELIKTLEGYPIGPSLEKYIRNDYFKHFWRQCFIGVEKGINIDSTRFNELIRMGQLIGLKK